MQVLKFGGTSVANPENILKVISIVKKAADKDRTILVLSAISGCTDGLLKIADLAAARDENYLQITDELQKRHEHIIHKVLPAEKQPEVRAACQDLFTQLRSILHGVYLLGELSPAARDAILSFGELNSTKIVAAKLSSEGLATRWVDARNILKAEHESGKTVVDRKTTSANVKKMIESNRYTNIFVIPGFIASDSDGKTLTLGRGGSDYSASLLAVGSNARVIEIWTDVSGIMTANPRIVPNAKAIRNISYRAALELSHFGAKVIYPPTIQPVVSEGIPIYVKNTFRPEDEGTLIEKNPPRGKKNVMGISNSDNIALISLEGSGMVGIPGFSARLFDALSKSEIDIILITQASSVHSMCIAIPEKDAQKAKIASDRCFAYEISLGKVNPLKVEKGYSIVCLVGDNIMNQCGTTGRMMAALGRNNIGIRATAQGSSERNVSAIVSSDQIDEAIRHIHEEFFDTNLTQHINIFIAGYGTVGKALVEMIRANAGKIAARTGKLPRICGLSNSRKYIVDTAGLDLDHIRENLENGESAANEGYFLKLASVSLENSVFVDCTASSDIGYKYANLFRKGYSVTACNKISFSSSYGQYKNIRDTMIENHVSLRYETTVGAALPILESIARSVHSGDEIQSVEAVLSGTLNYIFSSYDGGKSGSFADIVRTAQESGYAEPDPRLDLSGRDVLRKLIILSREAGIPLEESDVEISPILGPEFFEGSVEDFYAKLVQNEASFSARYTDAEKKGERLRFIASLRKVSGSRLGYKAVIGLENVKADHPLYRLEGTDNAAMITTEFYPSPLVIQGAGAGARQTASGLLNDIIL